MFVFEIFLKNDETKNEYQDYNKLFESIKKQSKKWYFTKLSLKYKNNIKKLGKSLKN